VATLISLLLILGTLLPATARASVLDAILSSITGKDAPQYDSADSSGNLETMPLLQPAMNIDPAPATGGGGITIVDDSALMPEEGPSGTIADIEKPKNGTITTYVVQPGDTLSGIAQTFNITTGTVLAANDLSRSAVIQPGEQLIILPITSIPYTVKKGDTIESIAKAFNGDVTEIESQNNVDDTSISVGQTILIPNGEASVSPASASSAHASSGAKPKPKPKSSSKVLKGSSAACGDTVPDADNPAEPSHDVGPEGTCTQIAYYIAPLQPGTYIQTQGIHGYNAVDLAPYGGSGAPIMAAATGDVIVARAGGWNGGYGSYVVINHANGSQTLYAHMSKVAAYDGEHVVQGQVIGYVGATGNATGPHVHFEIRDGIRNPF
jgi:murein DD-endopeptidase MepM/ murein hydrolase activator NlpD